MPAHEHPHRQRNIALLVAGTFFMENLDGTILTTAAPSIGNAFGVASLSVGVAITAYLLTLAVLIPLSGWLTQRFGARRIFLTAIAIFTIASILCALSQNLTELTVFRVLQGVGGALMVPVGRLAVLRVTSKADLIRTVALLTWPALAAPVIAPLVGGILTTYASWHWIFLINVPLGVIAFVVALRIVPREGHLSPPALDWLGLVLTGVGLGVLVYLGSLLAGNDQNLLELLVLAAVGLGLLGVATWHFLRAEHPLLRLSNLRVETFRLAHVGGSVFRMTISAVPFLLPLLFQDSFGYTPVVAGTLVLFVFVGNIGIKPFTTPLLRRFGFRTVIVAATAGAALSMVLCAFLTVDTPVVLVAILLIFSGVMRSTGFTAYNTIAFADIPQTKMTDANTFASTLQQVAAGFGVAIGAIALRAGEAATGAAGAGEAVGLSAFQFSFVVIGALTLLSTLEALRLSRSAGENIRPARPAV
ncbi:MFS transporter [Subtercola lobariae]|uniref:MFS transporter n=1 Tax=Subtercola lobariae TaxID=1588641 RepID=A0A917B8Q5_9MICO|nr:MFS transporter [Subtercola lobariae]